MTIIVAEEKRIYSIEKFLISRQLMYWQVYLHKTVSYCRKNVRKFFKTCNKYLQKNKIITPTSITFLEKIIIKNFQKKTAN